MQSRYELTAVLVIRHPTVDPALLTKEFGRTPQYCWQAGDIRNEAQADEAESRYRESYWVVKLDPSALPRPEDFGTPAGSAVASLEGALMFGALVLKRRPDLWTRLRSEGARAEIFVALANREDFTLKLPAELLSMMAGLGLSVSVDVEAYSQAAA
jgi:hypothetical protein